MAALQLLDDVPLDWDNLVVHINRRMPDHARPVFIRICAHVDPRLFRKKRRQLQEEGFNPALVKDPLYYFDLKRNAYLTLTPEKYQDIKDGKIAYKQENRPEDILLEATSVIYIRRTIP